MASALKRCLMDFYIERTIHAAPQDVATIMFDPDREAEWMEKGAAAAPLTPRPLAVGSMVGSRARRSAGGHGWPGSFVTKVTAVEPDSRLEMEIVRPGRHGFITYQSA